MSCPCRQAVPLTLALLNVSSPSLNAVDTLSRLSHDTDIHVAQSAVLALGKPSSSFSVPARISQSAVTDNCAYTGGNCRPARFGVLQLLTMHFLVSCTCA